MGRLILILLFFISSMLIAQNLKYERKSISITNVVLVSDPSIKLKQDEENYIVKKFQEYIEMPRFDYNPIPIELLSDFRTEVQSRGSAVSFDEVVEILKRKFVPKIIEILDIEKEIRSQNLLTEEQRNRFIATKAKSLGITAEQAIKIMNSAFICVPVISRFNKYTDFLSQTYTVELNAGIVWYRVIYRENGESDLNLVVKKETRGIGSAVIGKKIRHEGERVDYDEYAFRTATVALARDIQVATRDIPEFRLSAQVIEVFSNSISFPMGKREGIKVDDGFDLVELQEESDGKIVQKKIGFARVSKVGDNRTNPNIFSRARIIFGKQIEPGIYMSERPRLPIDVYAKLRSNPFSMTITIREDIFGSPYTVIDKMTGYSINAELLYNLGRNLDIPQLWIGAGIFFGSGDAGELDKIFDEKPNVGILGLNGILLKKFYFWGRFVPVAKAELVFERITLSRDRNKLIHDGLGLELGVGIEYVASPDLSFGLNLGYRLFAKTDEWVTENFSGRIPNLIGDHSGTSVHLYFNYSLPKLGFDPIAAVRGAVDW